MGNKHWHNVKVNVCRKLHFIIASHRKELRHGESVCKAEVVIFDWTIGPCLVGKTQNNKD